MIEWFFFPSCDEIMLGVRQEESFICVGNSLKELNHIYSKNQQVVGYKILKKKQNLFKYMTYKYK